MSGCENMVKRADDCAAWASMDALNAITLLRISLHELFSPDDPVRERFASFADELRSRILQTVDRDLLASKGLMDALQDSEEWRLSEIRDMEVDQCES